MGKSSNSDKKAILGLITFIFLLCFQMLGNPLFAQDRMIPAKTFGLAGSGVAQQNNVWPSQNVANIASTNALSVAVSASQAFGLSELQKGAVSVIIPTSFSAFGIETTSFGFDQYRESSISASIGKDLSFGTNRKFFVGAMVTYHTVSIDAYGKESAVGISAGWQVDALENLSIGFQGINLNLPSYTTDEELARSLSLGVDFAPSPQTNILLDVVKDVRFPFSLRGGIEVKPISSLALRTGFSTAPVTYAAGVGLLLGNLSADFGVQNHQVLGWSPAFGISYTKR